ncbi:MAG: hypothetical protein WDA24_11620 [Tissierellales bacterium]
MREEIKNILTMLEEGKISSRKALKLIKDLDVNNISKVRPARKIKIDITDGDDDKRIRLPGIPFWLISSFGRLGLLIAPMAIKRSGKTDENTTMALDFLKDVELKEFISALKSHGPFDFVDICSDKDIVKISVI